MNQAELTRAISSDDVALFGHARAEVEARQSPSQFLAVKDAAARICRLLNGEAAEAAARIASIGWGASDIVKVSKAISSLYFGTLDAATVESGEPIRLRL